MSKQWKWGWAVPSLLLVTSRDLIQPWAGQATRFVMRDQPAAIWSTVALKFVNSQLRTVSVRKINRCFGLSSTTLGRILIVLALHMRDLRHWHTGHVLTLQNQARWSLYFDFPSWSTSKPNSNRPLHPAILPAKASWMVPEYNSLARSLSARLSSHFASLGETWRSKTRSIKLVLILTGCC